MLTLTAIDLGAVAINSLLGMKLEALSTFDKYLSDERIVWRPSVLPALLDSIGNNEKFHILLTTI